MVTARGLDVTVISSVNDTNTIIHAGQLLPIHTVMRRYTRGGESADMRLGGQWEPESC
jgi:hypothetical protein